MKHKKLHNIKSPGFKVPTDYFESVEASVFEKIKSETTLTDIETPGFKTPKDYFDTVESKVFERLSKEKDVKVISLINRKTIIYISGIAAAILILFSLPIFESNPSFDNLETETVENYIIDENISSYEIASLLTEEHLMEDVSIDHNLDEKNIEDYLLENADIESLMIE